MAPINYFCTRSKNYCAKKYVFLRSVAGGVRPKKQLQSAFHLHNLNIFIFAFFVVIVAAALSLGVL